MKRVWSLAFPCKTFRITATETFFKHRTRHQHSRTLHFVKCPTIVSIWCITKLGRFCMDTYHIAILTIRYFEQFYRQTYRRFKLPHFVCYLTLGAICYVLTQNLQIGRYTKEQPSSICIQKCAQRLHTLNELACSLFQLQNAVFIFCYFCLYFVDVHIIKTCLLFTYYKYYTSITEESKV